MKALATAATDPFAGTKAFSYDANGNMVSDGRKGLQMSWNLLNLADSAAMYGGSLTYAWLSDGTKVAAKAADGSGNGVRKRYVGSFVYSSADEDGEDPPVFIEGIAWDEGRIFFAPIDVAVEEVYAEEGGEGIGGRSLRGRKRLRSREVPDSLAGVDSVFIDRVFHDCWFAGDHLGNVRSVIDITADLPAPEVLEQSDYLPYGTRIQNPDHLSGLDNRWRYAAKEEQRFGSTDAFTPPIPTAFGGAGSLDLSLLDFGARLYDPFTARWTAVDPLASKFVYHSTYIYCADSPINFVDLFGAEWVDDGKTIRVYVNLSVDPSLSKEQIHSYTNAINQVFNEVISNASGGKLQGEIVFSNGDPSVKQSLHLGAFDDPHIGGGTSYCYSNVNVARENGVLISSDEVALSVVHELFHTVRLDHPFEVTQTDDTKLICIGNNAFATTSSTDPNVVNNIMNYTIITIDGKHGTNMRYLTPQQLDFVRKEIELQKQGYGYPSESSHSYQEYYYDYWLNFPGTPVQR